MNPLYSALLHSHELFISLYVLLFLYKLILLLLNKTESLARFRQKSKVIGEMVLPMLFLLTGLYLAYTSGIWGETWFLIKLSLIIISIVTGIFAFRSNNKLLAILTFLIFIYIIMLSYIKDPSLKKPAAAIMNTENVITDPSAPGYDAVRHGQLLFVQNACTTCHGAAGNLGNHGAKDLSKSTLDDTGMETVIRDGRGNIMKGFGKSLTPLQMHALISFVKTLRK